MTTKFKQVLMLMVLSLVMPHLQAQTEKKAHPMKISLETDPSTFAFGGYAVHVRIQPRDSKHWLLGAGTYALDLPAAMVNLNPENKNKGWTVRINSAYSLFGEYYFHEANHRWFTGMQIGIQRYQVANSNFAEGNSKYSNLLIMPSIGYNWHPFRFPLYFKPWLGLGYTSKVSGSNQVNEAEYKIAPLVPFVTMHMGYTF